MIISAALIEGVALFGVVVALIAQMKKKSFNGWLKDFLSEKFLKQEI